MAVGTNQSALYYSIRNGKVTRYSKTQVDGTTVVPAKDGSPRFYFIYDFIEGEIESFRTREEEIAGIKKLFFQITMVDDGEKYIVDLDTDSNYFRAFAMTILSGDPDANTRLVPFMREEEGKKKTGLYVIQHGKPLKYKYTKESPGDMPNIEITKNKRGDIVDIDSEERNKFLFKELNSWIASGVAKGQTKLPAQVEDTFSTTEDFDDGELPF